MARIASGKKLLEKARECLAKARTVSELRQAQAVVFPLEFGCSMERTATMIGVSKGWACSLRTKFIRSGGECAERPPHGGRRHENMTIEEEKDFLSPFINKAKNGGILIVSEIKQALDKQLGRETALASVYNLLHRHDWRKLAPDKHHPKSDANAQAERKKTSQNSSRKSRASGLGKHQSN